MNIKEKAPCTAATVQSAKNSCQFDNTTDRTKNQVYLEDEGLIAEGIGDLLNALSTAMAFNDGYGAGVYLLSKTCFQMAQRLRGGENENKDIL